MYFFTFKNFFTNLIFVWFKPIRSSVTRTWPSQLTEDPIPIVGIFKSFVICFAIPVFTHSRTIAKTPVFWSNKASLMSCFLNKTVIYFKPIQPADEVVEVQTVKSETN